MAEATSPKGKEKESPAASPPVAVASAATPPPPPPPPVDQPTEAGAFAADLHIGYQGEGDDDDDDHDSALGDEGADSTASISSSILHYRTIHGRTFHSQLKSEGEYWGPNDDKQIESMDITHHVMTLMLDDKLFLAPISDDVDKVLDVGTGSGIWAIDFADRFPGANITGTDISPMQPPWVPPNLKFEIDDCTLEWTWAEDSFDFVHMRMLFGSIADWPALYRQAFRVTKSGTGWFESFESSVDVLSDDGSIDEGNVLYQWGKIFAEAGVKMGRSMTVADDPSPMVGWMKDAGFVDVHEQTFKIPISGWPRDIRLRDIGRFNYVAINEGLEGYALYMLTQVLGWSHTEAQVYIAKVRRALKNTNNHGYFIARVVYGRKPDA